MMYEEFCNLIRGFDPEIEFPTWQEYHDVIEPVYMDIDVDVFVNKQMFCACYVYDHEFCNQMLTVNSMLKSVFEIQIDDFDRRISDIVQDMLFATNMISNYKTVFEIMEWGRDMIAKGEKHNIEVYAVTLRDALIHYDCKIGDFTSVHEFAKSLLGF